MAANVFRRALPPGLDGSRRAAVQWAVIVSAAVIAAVLGYIGFGEYSSHLSVSDRIYRTLQLFRLDAGSPSATVPVTLQIARLVAPIATFGAVIRALLSLF